MFGSRAREISKSPEKGAKRPSKAGDDDDAEFTVVHDKKKQLSSTFITEEDHMKKLYGYCVVSKDPHVNMFDNGLTYFRGSPKASHSDERFSFDSDFYVNDR